LKKKREIVTIQWLKPYKSALGVWGMIANYTERLYYYIKRFYHCRLYSLMSRFIFFDKNLFFPQEGHVWGIS
jgi:hypothetical protein